MLLISRVTSFLFILSSTLGQSQDSIYSVWTHSFGSEYDESPVSIRQIPQNGFVIAATQWGWNPDSFRDVWISKIDSNGIEEWHNVLDFDGREDLNDMELLCDGSILLTGQIDDKVWVAKVDSVGKPLWTNLFFDNHVSNSGKDIMVISENHILIAGTRQDSVLLINMNSDGTILWQYTYSYFEHLLPEGIAVDKLPDGRTVIGANIWDMAGDNIYARPGVYFVDSLGAYERLEIYGNYEITHHPLVDIEVTTSGKVLILGLTFNGPNYDDSYLTLVDSNGDELWTELYGSGDFEGVSDLHIDNYGNYLVCGFTKGFGIPNNRDFWVFKSDSVGNVIWNYVFGTDEWESANSVTSINGGEYIVAGYIPNYDDLESQIVVQKLLESKLGVYNSYVVPHTVQLFQNYPNPFNPVTTIKFYVPQATFVTLTIYDLLGREVETLLSRQVDAGLHKVQWEAGSAPSGIYFVRMRAGNSTHARRIVLLE